MKSDQFIIKGTILLGLVHLLPIFSSCILAELILAKCVLPLFLKLSHSGLCITHIWGSFLLHLLPQRYCIGSTRNWNGVIYFTKLPTLQVNFFLLLYWIESWISLRVRDGLAPAKISFNLIFSAGGKQILTSLDSKWWRREMICFMIISGEGVLFWLWFCVVVDFQKYR